MNESLKKRLLGTTKEREQALRMMLQSIESKRRKQRKAQQQYKRDTVKRTLRKNYA